MAGAAYLEPQLLHEIFDGATDHCTVQVFCLVPYVPTFNVQSQSSQCGNDRHANCGRRAHE